MIESRCRDQVIIQDPRENIESSQSKCKALSKEVKDLTQAYQSSKDESTVTKLSLEKSCAKLTELSQASIRDFDHKNAECRDLLEKVDRLPLDCRLSKEELKSVKNAQEKLQAEHETSLTKLNQQTQASAQSFEDKDNECKDLSDQVDRLTVECQSSKDELAEAKVAREKLHAGCESAQTKLIQYMQSSTQNFDDKDKEAQELAESARLIRLENQKLKDDLAKANSTPKPQSLAAADPELTQRLSRLEDYMVQQQEKDKLSKECEELNALVEDFESQI